MKNITKEKIDNAINNVTTEICNNIHEQYICAIEEANNLCDTDILNNPIAREEIAISIAQHNSVTIIQKALYELLLD